MTNGFNFLIYKTPDKDVKVNAVIKDDTIASSVLQVSANDLLLAISLCKQPIKSKEITKKNTFFTIFLSVI